MTKFTEVQWLRLHESMRHASELLRSLKTKPQKGKDLERMKELEAAVDHLQNVNVMAGNA